MSVASRIGDSAVCEFVVRRCHAEVDLGAEEACTNWAKPVEGPIITHAGVFQTLTRTPSMQPRIVPTRLPLQMMLACSSLQIRPS